MNPGALRPTALTASRHAGQDVLVDTATGAPFPAARIGSLLRSSLPLGWSGIIVEQHRLPPRSLGQDGATDANYGVAKPKVTSPRGKLNAFQLRAVLERIESQFDEDVSLLTLARQAHISPFHFARLFRATVGVSPHQFVLRLRLERAARFMKAGKMPLAQIAVECGFHDQPHFTRAFKRVFRITPAMYLPRR